MKEDENKTRAQLIAELDAMRKLLSQQKSPAYSSGYINPHNNNAKQYLDTADVIILVVSRDETISLINRKACELLGYSVQGLSGKNFFNTLVPRRLRSGLRKQFKWLMSGKIELIQMLHENAILTRSGEEKTITWQASVLTDEIGNISGMIASGVDITERKKAEEALRSMLFLDELTGLYNRRGFQAMARQQLSLSNRTKNEILVLFADIDGMKQINDTFGHREGDHALQDAAAVLRQTFRQSDIIARIGGDEFIVLALGSKDLDATTIMARLDQNVLKYNEQQRRPFNLSISMGIVGYVSQFPHSIDEFIARADKLMYQKKKTAKARIKVG